MNSLLIRRKNEGRRDEEKTRRGGGNEKMGRREKTEGGRKTKEGRGITRERRKGAKETGKVTQMWLIVKQETDEGWIILSPFFLGFIIYWSVLNIKTFLNIHVYYI